MSQKCEQFSYGPFFEILGDCWSQMVPLRRCCIPWNFEFVILDSRVVRGRRFMNFLCESMIFPFPKSRKLHFSLNVVLRVSFSPGRDRACRHCWISSFWTRSGKRRLYFSRGPLFKPPGRTFF